MVAKIGPGGHESAADPLTRDRARARPRPRRLRTALERWPAAGPLAAAAIPALVVILLQPHPVDLAAHEFRAALFEREGFTVWNGQWYSGHHTPAYSVVFPPLAALLGPTVAGVLACLAAAVLFEALARHHFGPAARWGALWFGVATGVNLFTGRMPFALGVTLGLAALLALQRERRVPATALALLCPLASPVAGLFLALAGVTCVLAGRGGLRRGGAVVAVSAIAPALLLAAAFPEGGRFPFALSAFFPVPLLAAAAALLLHRSERVLRTGAALYGLATVGALIVASPVGGNAARLGALFGGPLLACAMLAGRTRRLPVGLAAAGLAALAVWQVGPAARDLGDSLSDPAAGDAYYRPLTDFLEGTAPAAARIEVVATKAHRETAVVAKRFPLARGWERQLDIRHNSLFYEGRLDDGSYQRWLTDNAVAFVALPDSALDYSAEAERRLVERDPPYLELRFRSRRWRVYEVVPGPELVVPEGDADISARLDGDRVALTVRRPGSALVRVRWTPYWRVDGGCLEPRDGWTRVTVRRPGRAVIATSLTPERLLSRGRRCS